jgi:hypothetical protein
MGGVRKIPQSKPTLSYSEISDKLAILKKSLWNLELGLSSGNMSPSTLAGGRGRLSVHHVSP